MADGVCGLLGWFRPAERLPGANAVSPLAQFGWYKAKMLDLLPLHSAVSALARAWSVTKIRSDRSSLTPTHRCLPQVRSSCCQSWRSALTDLPQNQLEQVCEIVKRHLHSAEVFAFGSRVNGRAKMLSDLDLDLILKPATMLPWRTLPELRGALEASDLPITVDVVDWNSCTEKFQSRVAPQLVQVF